MSFLEAVPTTLLIITIKRAPLNTIVHLVASVPNKGLSGSEKGATSLDFLMHLHLHLISSFA